MNYTEQLESRNEFLQSRLEKLEKELELANRNKASGLIEVEFRGLSIPSIKYIMDVSTRPKEFYVKGMGAISGVDMSLCVTINRYLSEFPHINSILISKVYYYTNSEAVPWLLVFEKTDNKWFLMEKALYGSDYQFNLNISFDWENLIETFSDDSQTYEIP